MRGPAAKHFPEQRSGFAGWRMLAIAILAGSFTGPGQTIGVSVFIQSFVRDLNLTDDDVGLAYLVGTLLGATAMPAVGRGLDRFGVRWGQMAIVALFGLALANMALVQNWVWLAAGFVFIRMLGQGSLSMTSTVTVALWFDRLRGRAMGILGIGVAAGIALTPVLLNQAILNLGWRQAWVLAAITVPAILLPVTFFGLVDSPEQIGQQPDGQAAPGPGNEPRLPKWGLTRKEALGEPAFWVIAVMSTLTSMLITGLNFHQIDLLTSHELTESEAAAMFLPQIVGSTVSAAGIGWLIDKVSGRVLPAAALIMLTISLALSALLGNAVLVITYALSLGVTAGATKVISTSLLPKWFGTAHIGSLQGLLSLMVVGGSSLGPFALSSAKGQLGGYRPAVLLLAILPVAAAGCSVFVKAPQHNPAERDREAGTV